MERRAKPERIRETMTREAMMDREGTMTPPQAVGHILGELQRRADPARARGAERYFRERVSFFGLTTPVLRALVDGLYRQVREGWGLEQALAFCEAMLAHDRFEARTAGTLLLLKFRRWFEPDLAARIRGWLESDRLDNWAAVDTLCPDALGPLLVLHPALAAELRSWTAHPNRWVQRAALVSYIKLARRGTLLEEAYGNCERLFSSGDDLVHKACGWLLREAGKTDPRRLEAFLRRHGPRIPRTALRYAIERFPESKRKELLHHTRAERPGRGA